MFGNGGYLGSWETKGALSRCDACDKRFAMLSVALQSISAAAGCFARQPIHNSMQLAQTE